MTWLSTSNISSILASTITPTFSSSPPAAGERRKKIGKKTFGEKVTSRERTGGGRKGRGAEWREKDRPERDGTDGGKKDVYYAGRDEGRKRKGRL